MTPKKCPDCGRSISWRNAALQCLDCGREYCKECPDYTHGRFDVRCPDCGCPSARPLRSADDAGPIVPPLDRARRKRNGRRWRSLRAFRPGPRGRRPPSRRADAPDVRPTDGTTAEDDAPEASSGDPGDTPERSGETPSGDRFPFTF